MTTPSERRLLWARTWRSEIFAWLAGILGLIIIVDQTIIRSYTNTTAVGAGLLLIGVPVATVIDSLIPFGKRAEEPEQK